jgi:hypothetical protein
MKIKNTTSEISLSQLTKELNIELTTKQKVKLAKDMSDFYGTIDMSYIEELLVMAAKVRLKSIKKDKKLYARNQKYFKALKIITQLKTAE